MCIVFEAIWKNIGGLLCFVLEVVWKNLEIS